MNDDVVKRGNNHDTRRWCKGRVGVAHQYVWRNYCIPTKWYREVCQVCGRYRRLWCTRDGPLRGNIAPPEPSR